MPEHGSAPRGATATQQGATRTMTRPVLIGVGVVVAVALVVVGVLFATGNREPATTPAAVTVTNPAPSPAIEPVAKEAGSPFYDLLPATVLQLALASAVTDESPEVAGALEAHTLTYSDGGDVEVTVRASQWRSVDAATRAQQAVLGALGEAAPEAERRESPVEAGGGQAGTLIVLTAGDEAHAVWTNGTALLVASGPADLLEKVVAAYPV
ncbi:MAG: hypothetical protein ACTMIR_02620 [Cellulomonadaceae bacterium]